MAGHRRVGDGLCIMVFLTAFPPCSESSMLVSQNRFILKTCGTIALLYAIKPLMSLVQETFPGAIVMVSGERKGGSL